MPVQIKNLYLAPPYSLTAKDFMHRHGFTPNRSAVVQLRDGYLNPRSIIVFILHSV